MKTLYKFSVKNGDSVTEFDFVEISKAVSREGEMIYAREYAECIRNKLLSNAEALKIVNERGGVFTDEEKDEFVKNLAIYLEKEKALEMCDEDAREKLKNEFESAKQKVLFYQSKQDEIYTYTAESKSRDAVILHYALALTYTGGKLFFEGKDYNARSKVLETSDEFKQNVLKRSTWFATAAFYSIPADSKDIQFPEDRIKPVAAPEPAIEEQE